MMVKQAGHVAEGENIPSFDSSGDDMTKSSRDLPEGSTQHIALMDEVLMRNFVNSVNVMLGEVDDDGAKKGRKKRQAWTKEEEDILSAAVEKYGKRWLFFSKEILKNRTVDQIRERWRTHLDKKIRDKNNSKNELDDCETERRHRNSTKRVDKPKKKEVEENYYQHQHHHSKQVSAPPGLLGLPSVAAMLPQNYKSWPYPQFGMYNMQPQPQDLFQQQLQQLQQQHFQQQQQPHFQPPSSWPVAGNAMNGSDGGMMSLHHHHHQQQQHQQAQQQQQFPQLYLPQQQQQQQQFQPQLMMSATPTRPIIVGNEDPSLQSQRRPPPPHQQIQIPYPSDNNNGYYSSSSSLGTNASSFFFPQQCPTPTSAASAASSVSTALFNYIKE